MKVIFDKDKVYMEALKAFRHMLDTRFKDGGQLPTSIAMCKKLNISSATYVKVTKLFADEGVIHSVPGKGIYALADKYRLRKIGLVIGDGRESPFIMGNCIVSEVIACVWDAGYRTQLIQGSNIMNVQRSAIAHYVDAIIWVLSPNPHHKEIVNMYKHKQLPMILVYPYYMVDDIRKSLSCIPSVSEDYKIKEDKIRTFFNQRGHSNFLVSGTFIKPENIADTIIKENVTGILAEGQLKVSEAVFQALSMLPEQKRPELVVHYFDTLPELSKEYPEINITAVCSSNQKIFGRMTVDILLKHLRTGKEMGSFECSTYNIHEIKQDLQNVNWNEIRQSCLDSN